MPPVVPLLPLFGSDSAAALVFFLSPYCFWIASASAVKLRLELARKTAEALGLASEAARARRAGSRSGDDDDDSVTETFFALPIAAVGGTVALLLSVARDAASAAASPPVETAESSRRESAARAEEMSAARCRRRAALGIASRAIVFASREKERESVWPVAARFRALCFDSGARGSRLCALCACREQVRES